MSEVPQAEASVTSEQREALLDALDAAERELARARDKYLRATGWKHTCDTPGSRWQWQKRLPDGRVVVCSPEAAVQMESYL